MNKNETSGGSNETGELAWIGVRQIQSIRDALGWSLGGQTTGHANINSWLASQGMPEGDYSEPPISAVLTSIENKRIELLGRDVLRELNRGRRGAFETDIGTSRAGAGWDQAANFCITSAFIRLLGAWEQFELDVLKTLLLLRPGGLAGNRVIASQVEVPDLSKVHEVPTFEMQSNNKRQKVYKHPSKWTKVSKRVLQNGNRRDMLKGDYGIDIMSFVSGASRDASEKMIDDWYERRNDLAHGRSAIMSLAEYTKADVFVHRSIVSVAEQCRRDFNIRI
ncbi:MAG: hypothetical protein H6818_06785 [Phycisphaerales bacterium]|nr:hypothetical protein [Phycisphaerales bacterium]MCB9864862.1 hypothetical protein [Phycisphaerales bacterium]